MTLWAVRVHTKRKQFVWCYHLGEASLSPEKDSRTLFFCRALKTWLAP